MQAVETGEIAKIYERKIWIETDFHGDKHVMIQHQDGESEPFCYCSFFYDHRYTSNSNTHAAAENMAKALGAQEPIEYRSRSISFAIPTIPESLNKAYVYAMRAQMVISRSKSERALREVPDDLLDISRMQLLDLVVRIESEQKNRYSEYAKIAENKN
ncbi:hypothetical protein HW932_18720 [Allochromatium humboldtianum]|uniref:Uncharacterized protein n=1 Tax=Allochromatium humboldtianum TaxID=504901 RepID=A0A850RD68_9GAMM|nr:hypothetical protein [Allochromatium humboldtianum]NVZ11288.1 hypothetical protein [Allochromatium humboldtianum]